MRFLVALWVFDRIFLRAIIIILDLDLRKCFLAFELVFYLIFETESCSLEFIIFCNLSKKFFAVCNLELSDFIYQDGQKLFQENLEKANLELTLDLIEC